MPDTWSSEIIIACLSLVIILLIAAVVYLSITLRALKLQTTCEHLNIIKTVSDGHRDLKLKVDALKDEARAFAAANRKGTVPAHSGNYSMKLRPMPQHEPERQYEDIVPRYEDNLVSDYNRALADKEFTGFEGKYEWQRGGILNVSERLKNKYEKVRFGPSNTGNFIIVKHHNLYNVFPYWALDVTETVKVELDQYFRIAEVAIGGQHGQFNIIRPAVFDLLAGKYEMVEKGELSILK